MSTTHVISNYIIPTGTSYMPVGICKKLLKMSTEVKKRGVIFPNLNFQVKKRAYNKVKRIFQTLKH